MFKINYFKYDGRWLAYLEEDSEYYEIGRTSYEAIGMLLELLIENKQIETIELKELDETEHKSDIEIKRKLVA